MKHFNRLLVALVFGFTSMVSFGQATCATAVDASAAGPFTGNTLTANVADSVWYYFDAAADGYLTISSCDIVNNYNTRLELYETATLDCNDLVLIATSDDDCGLAALINDRPVVTGRRYYLLWDNPSASDYTLSFDLEFVNNATYMNPANDDACDATALTLDSWLNGQTNEYATLESLQEENLRTQLKNFWNVDSRLHNSVWYSFVAPASGQTRIQLRDGGGAAFEAQYALLSVTDCNDLSTATVLSGAQSDLASTLSFNNYCLTPGATYYVLVDGFGTESSLDFDVRVRTVDLTDFGIQVQIDSLDHLCPGQEIFDLNIAFAYNDFVSLSDSNAITPIVGRVEYKDALVLAITGDSVYTKTGDDEVTYSVGAGTYTISYTDICGTVFSTVITLADTVLSPLAITVNGTEDPNCPQGSPFSSTGSIDVDFDGGYKFVDGSYGIPTDSLLIKYNRANDPDATDAFVINTPDFSTTVGNLNEFDGLPRGKYMITVEDACGNTDTTYAVLRDHSSSPVAITSIDIVNPYCPTDFSGSVNINTIGGVANPNGSLRFYVQYDADTTIATGGGINFGAPTPSLINDDKFIDGLQAGFYRVRAFDFCFVAAGDADTIQIVDPTVADIEVTAATFTAPSAVSVQDGSIDITVTGGKENRVTWYLDPSFDGSGDVIIPSGTVLSSIENNFNPTALGQGIYAAYVNDSCTSAGDSLLVFKLFAPVANDEPCDAIAIAIGDTAVTFSNVGATVGAGENAALSIPQFNDDGYRGWFDNNVQQSVWFKFIAPASGSVNITTEHLHYSGNFNFDPQVAVFEVSDCNTFASYDLLAANDNILGGGTTNNDSYLQVFCLTPGTEYYVLVDGYVGAGSQEGVFQIDLEENLVNPLTATAVATQPTCGTTIGKVVLSAVNGGVFLTTPETYGYTYTFVGGAVNQSGDVVGLPINFNALPLGTYTLTVSDTCGNSVVKTFDIESNAFDAITADITVTQPRCPNDTDFGKFVFDIAGGGTPGTYTWTVYDDAAKTGGDIVQTGVSVKDSIGDDTFGGNAIGEGLYYLVIEDACAPINTKEYVIELTDPVLTPLVATVDPFSATCATGGDGGAVVTVTGGSGYFYVVNHYGDDSSTDIVAPNQERFDGEFKDTTTMADVNDGVFLIPNSEGNYILLAVDYCEFDVNGGGTYAAIVDATLRDTVEYTIADPVAPAIVIDGVVTSSEFGLDNGIISFTVTGGFLPYTSVVAYSAVSDGGADIAPVVIINDSLTSLAPGWYRVGATDNCGNTLSEYFQVFERPTNDDVCSATLLALATPTAGTTSGATVQASVAAPANNGDCDAVDSWCGGAVKESTVWYKVVVPASGSFKVDVDNDALTFNPKIAAYLSNDCANLGSPIAANEDVSIVAPIDTTSSLTLGCLTAGDTVYILVDGNDDLTGTFTITATSVSTGALNVNANVTNATTITSNDGQVQVNVTGGVKPYTYTWLDNGVASVTVEDRTGLAPGVYTLTVEDACGTIVTKTYILDYVTVDNDDVCNAFVLPVDGVNRVYSNEGASVQAGEPAPLTNGDCFSNTESKWCSGDGLDGSVWFKFTAPASGNVNVSLCNDALNTFDTQVAVYKASLCGNFGSFVLVGANDDLATCSLGSGVELTGLTACATYYVQVDSDNATEGDFGIQLTDPSATLNAGPDVVLNECVNYADVILANELNAGADAGGYFLDATGNVVTTFVNNDVEGTFVYTYVVADSCGSTLVAADYATYTINVGACVGINESAETTFGVYPNPNKGSFTVNSNALKLNGTLVVTDLSGRIVYTLDLADVNTNAVDVVLNNAAAGVYMVRLRTENESFVQRVVVE